MCQCECTKYKRVYNLSMYSASPKLKPSASANEGKKFKHLPLNSDITVRTSWKSGVCMNVREKRERQRKIEEKNAASKM